MAGRAGGGEATRRSEGVDARGRKPGGAGSGRLAALRERIGIPRHLALLAVVVGVWMLAGGLVIPFLNLYFLREHGFDVARIGVLFGIAQAVTALVVFGSGDLAGRFGARRMLLVWAAPFAPMLWVMALAGSALVATVIYVAQGFVAPATNPLIDQLLLERAPRARRGAVSTWRNAATELSGLIGASLGGVLLQATTFRTLFVTAGVVALAGFSALVVLLRAQAAD
jgi:predicted MFS family arabinose efflux permease